MKRLLSTIVAVCLFGGASATIVLPKVLGSNMVLQQQSEVNLWGKAEPNRKVTVEASWSDAKILTRSDAEWPLPKRRSNPEA